MESYGGHVYIIVDRSLSIAQQAVQGSHAAIEAVRCGIIPSNGPHPHLVFCKTNNLDKELLRLHESGISHQPFYEPDLGDRLTAIATEPVFGDLRGNFRKLQLVR